MANYKPPCFWVWKGLIPAEGRVLSRTRKKNQLGPFVCLFVIKKVPPLFSLRKLSKTWKVFSCFVSKKIFFVLNQQESIEQLKDVAEYVEWCFRSLLWQQWAWKRFTKKLQTIIRIFFISIFIEHRICIQIANKFCKHKLFFNN